jgi:hypothetical protein
MKKNSKNSNFLFDSIAIYRVYTIQCFGNWGKSVWLKRRPCQCFPESGRIKAHLGRRPGALVANRYG